MMLGAPWSVLVPLRWPHDYLHADRQRGALPIPPDGLTVIKSHDGGTFDNSISRQELLPHD
jgi:hypothetical protein